MMNVLSTKRVYPGSWPREIQRALNNGALCLIVRHYLLTLYHLHLQLGRSGPVKLLLPVCWFIDSVICCPFAEETIILERSRDSPNFSGINHYSYWPYCIV